MKKLVRFLVFTFLLFTIISLVKSETGTVEIEVLNMPYWVNITHPLNTTYTEASGSTITLQLNVTSNFTANTWWYKLTRIENNQVINSSVIFTPNTTIVAVSGTNNLTVYANDSDNRIFTDEVIFYINVPNSAPEIKNLDASILICEDESLSGDYYFNATDPDGDYITITLNQTDIFAVLPNDASPPPVNAELLTTKTMAKSDTGTHKRTISVTDGSLAATQETTITVIEINHAPAITSPGVQTIYLYGSPNNFYHQMQVSDTEHGNQNSGNFSFNLTSTPALEIINITANGTISFTPNITYSGNYNITINVTDPGLTAPHAQILTECSQTGLNMSSNITFQLTISNQSTPPYFTSYYPTSLAFTETDTTAIYFNISTQDNESSLPDARWYVDGVFKELDQLSLTDEFTYTFGCGNSGLHKITVNITDGIFNNSLQWNITLIPTTCPVSSPGGGGGGGGGGTTKSGCQEKWACYNWQNCQNAERTFLIGLLEGADYQEIKTKCKTQGLNDNTCGFQLRDCFDINECNTILNRASQIQECHFTENPNCEDNIKNCHDSSCELLIDCGGPCQPCPTCTDNLQNQGEENTDCGGPCSIMCSPEKPLLQKPEIKFTLYLILIVLTIMAIIKLTKILKTRKQIKTIQSPKATLKILLVIISIIFITALTTAQCFPQYKCEDWSECIDGFQTRICADNLCDSPDLIERTTCVQMGGLIQETQTKTTWTYVEETNQLCSPQIQCNQWSDCTYTEKITNIIKENMNYGGYKERTCEDLADCIPTFTERGQCEEFSQINLEKIYNNNQVFLLVSDKVSKQPIAKVNINSWKKENKLDIIITQQKTNSNPLCFNSIRDNNEEKTDCGGPCKPCEKTKKQLPLTKLIIAFWFLALAFLLSFAIQSLPIKKIYFRLRQLNFNT